MRATESEIQASYQGREVAQGYVSRRFDSELGRLMHQKQVAAVQQAAALVRPQRVLEIAPGPGRLTRDVRVPGRLVCLEFNEGMIEVGRAACPPQVTWVRGNAFELPFGTEAPFDMVYTFRFIRHFKRDDRRRLYGQIARVLRPGGLLVFDAVNAAVSKSLREEAPEAYPIYDVLYDRFEDLRAELTEAGFTVEAATPVQKAYRAQYRTQCLLGPRSAWLNRMVIGALERCSPGPCLEWVVTAKRETK